MQCPGQELDHGMDLEAFFFLAQCNKRMTKLSEEEPSHMEVDNMIMYYPNLDEKYTILYYPKLHPSLGNDMITN
jgi:hypothetical protein